jgi:hypothetical protein
MHVLPKMDTSFDLDDDLSTAFGLETLAERDMKERKTRDLRTRLAISRLIYLEKTLLGRIKQETSSIAMAELPRKRPRHYTLLTRSSGGIAINLCMGPSVYGPLTPCLYPRWLPSANGPSAVPKSSLPRSATLLVMPLLRLASA